MRKNLIPAKQIAEKWGVSLRRVQLLCQSGRIEGCERISGNWMIPADARRPSDGRYKEAKMAGGEDNKPLIRKSPFLIMTDLYHTPGTADQCIEALAHHAEAKALFSAEIAYSRGEIDKVYEHAQYFIEKHSGFYAVIAGGMLLSQCAMWNGDLQMWKKAKRHICEAPCKTDTDRDILALSLAAVDSAIRATDDYPEWFQIGNFEPLPPDAHPAARIYYLKYLMIFAHDLAIGRISLPDVNGLGLMRSIPYIAEPMISQAVAEQTVVPEIYLRLLCAVAYNQSGNNAKAAAHLDKAIRLCLADGLYAPLVEHRHQLGLFLDERLLLIDSQAARKVRELHKQVHANWVKLHNAVMKNSVSASLTVREREVARYWAFRMSNTEIAERLHISPYTVTAILNSIRSKTGATSRAEIGAMI